MKFFKKVSPAVQLQLSNGLALKFDNVDDEWGILKTANPTLLSELAACIKGEIGGVFEIDEAEYNSLTEKKTTFRPTWREEITKSGAAPKPPSQTSPRSDPQSVAVSLERGFEPPPADRVTPTAQQTPSYRPNATPRS